MRKINMLSSADKVAGQGVGSATAEQISLIKEGLGNLYQIEMNQKQRRGISHYHTIDFKHYLHILFTGKKNAKVGHVHFLPETIDGSIKLPPIAKQVFYKYIVHFYKQMDYLVTVNPYFIERLVDHGVSREKIYYIPNYVSKDEFHPLPDTAISEIKKQYNIDESGFVVLGVGQIQTRKGILDFVEIAKKNPDKQFVWAGGFSFGKITDGYEALKKVVDQPPANVKFIGIVERSEMNSLYNMASVLFMPSYNELFPMSILEAMNTKTPLLLRELDIYVDILQGYYLKANDNNEFNGIINQLNLEQKFYIQAKEMSEKGSLFYSKGHVLTMWQEFYEMVYSEKVATKEALVDSISIPQLIKKKLLG